MLRNSLPKGAVNTDVYMGSKEIKFFKANQFFLQSYQTLSKFSTSYLK